MNRYLIAFLLALVLALGVAYDRFQNIDVVADGTEVANLRVSPAIADPAQLDLAWYCPVGSSVSDGYADHSITLTNFSDSVATGNLRILTEEGAGPTVRLEVTAQGEERFVLSEFTERELASAVVETIGGDVVVSHRVETDRGFAEGPCSTRIDDQWYFASGSTSRDSSNVIAIMNPFPENAIVNVEFRAADRSRRPSSLEGTLVPAESVITLDVGEFLARNPAFTTNIEVVAGRVAAERLQKYDGSLGPQGVSLTLPSSAPAERWFLPAGKVHAEGTNRITVYNPNDEVAEVSIGLALSGVEEQDQLGLVPLQLTVPPNRFETINLFDEATRFGVPLPNDIGAEVLVENDVPVLVERGEFAPKIDESLIGAGGSGAAEEPEEAPEGEEEAQAEADATIPANGVSTTAGVEILSKKWIVPSVDTGVNASVIVLAPSGAQVEVSTFVSGQSEGPTRVSVDKSGRAVVPLEATGVASVVIESDMPVATEARIVRENNLEIVPGIPTIER